MKYIIALLLFCFTATTQVLGQRLLTDEAESVTGEDIVERAMKYIGVPYRSGNMNPKIGFDCSGFTTYVFKKENILLTRSSRTQFKEGVKVDSKKELQKGDLVFFGGSSSKKTIGHVGIVTDGDLRRHMCHNIMELTAKDLMTPNPVCIEGEALSAKAKEMMERKKISSVFVVNKSGDIAGIVTRLDV